jgi:asparagine synthase (glutamine-hydrolysing)
MLIGAAGTFSDDQIHRLRAAASGSGPLAHWRCATNVAVGVGAWGVAPLDAEERFAADAATGSWVCVSGHLYGEDGAEASSRPRGMASRLLSGLMAHGIDGARRFEGTFAMAWLDGRTGRLALIRDAFGAEPLFFAEAKEGVLFGSRIRELRRAGLVEDRLSLQGLAEYLTFCFIPGDGTLDLGVHQVPPGSAIVIAPGQGIVERRRWYHLSFAGQPLRDEREIEDRFRTLLERAVAKRIDVPRLGAFLSGGMDSSSVVTFVRRHRQEPLRTYSYRCAGKSFDESVYARQLAEIMGTEHCEVEYGEVRALEIADAVKAMDMPLCNIGLEMGSWLLGEAAAGKVDCILTGDGGDELWASHPVYAAQRVMDVYERLPIPRAVNGVLLSLAARLSDSDRKRDLRVKLKRILPPVGMPRALGPFRWLAYYVPADFEWLLEPEVARGLRDKDPFGCVLRAYDGYDGPDDGLSPHLYNDYRTSTGSYFSRLRMLRHFGVETRYPFYERELVELGARVPARLKLEGIERTKRLFRAAMEGVLPDAINHRKDKLGHSIPFKNWLRRDGPLADRVASVLTPSVLRSRGLFRPDAVARLIEEHRSRRANHSHRIWALYVLELWLQAREQHA